MGGIFGIWGFKPRRKNEILGVFDTLLHTHKCVE